MYSGARAAAKVPLAEYIMSQGIVYKAFPHRSRKAKFISAFRSCITLSFVIIGLHGSFSSMNCTAMRQRAGENP